MTTMPRCVAAATSMLSTPMPARPITLRLVACSSSAFVTLVAERTARPSNCPMIRFSSSGASPVITCASMPRSAKIAAARALSASAINTFAMVSVPEEDDGVWLFFGSARAPNHPHPDPPPSRGREISAGYRSSPPPLRGRVRVGGETCTDLRSVLRRLRAPQLAICPVEPRQQRLDIAALDRGAGPDPEAGRRVAMAGDVVGDALLLEQRREFLD